MNRYDSGQLDDLLLDVKKLLGDETPAPPQPSPRARRPAPQPTPAQTVDDDATRLFAPVRGTPPPTIQGGAYDGSGKYVWNDPSYTGEYHGPDTTTTPRPAPRPAPRVQTPPSAFDQPVEPLRRAAPVQEAPRQRAAAHAAVQAEARPKRTRRPQPEPEAEVDEMEETQYPVKRKKKKAVWIILALLVVGLLVGYLLLAKQPINKDANMGARKPGVSTILLVGTDKSSTLTDTIMLLSLNTKEKTVSLMSIPRDTRVNGPYKPPKINSVYGANQGDERIGMLMQRVGECIGFEPDGYLVVNLDSFVSLVDIMGGVKFDVPMDMNYSDPAQNLTINLQKGEQELDGMQAMGLVRFRSGYAAADLERVNVQRAFVSAAADQWMTPGVIFKAPQLLAWFGKNVETNLSTGNMTWIALALLRADKSAIAAQTLPGDATYIGGVSFYLLNPYDVVAAVNESFNPYEKDITVDDLKVRN